MITYKKVKYKGKVLEIFYQEDCESPREDCNLTLLHIPNNNYINEVKNVDKRDIAHILPLYRYSHGNVAYNTTGFNAVGIVGELVRFIYPKRKFVILWDANELVRK